MARVISGLTGGGIEHSIACLRGEPEIANRLPSRVRIHCLHSPPNEPGLPMRLARLVREECPTVIHARNWGAWPDISVGRLLVRPRTPLVLSFHGLGEAGYMPWRRRCASYVLARAATALVTVSARSKQLMVAKWGWPNRRVEVIPNGVDTDRFCPANQPGSQIRFTVGTIGNLRPVKNHAMLIEACAMLVRRGVNLEARIAGEGDERDRLVALAESLGVADRVKLLGYVENTPAFLQQLDVFVLSSDSEQHPNALNEAMACGLACVATRVGCVGELLDEGRCGRIVDPGSRTDMADAIADLAADAEQRREYGMAARRRACERYSLSAMLAAYRELYTRLSERPYRRN